MGNSPESPGAGEAGAARPRWARGCGVGCGVVLALGIVGLLVVTFLLQRTFRGIQNARASYEDLVTKEGPVEDYVPPTDGVPSEDRWEVFLQVRGDTASAREDIQATVDRMSSSFRAARGPAGTMRVAFETITRLIEEASAYLVARDRALVARDMGPGEYVYLYALAYYSALGHRPGDPIPSSEEAENGEGGADLFGEDDATFGPSAVRRRYRRYTLGMVRAQLESVDPSDEDLRTALERELHQMEVDPGRVLWQDGLPSALAASVAPIRGRLEAQYDPITNRLELPLAAHEMQ